MTRPLGRILLSCTLALALAMTGLAAAAARGQTRIGDHLLVLCSGGGLVQVAADAEGRPTGKAHLCPDLALSLVSATAVAPPALPAPSTRTAEDLTPDATAGHAQGGVVATARGPPVPV